MRYLARVSALVVVTVGSMMLLHPLITGATTDNLSRSYHATQSISSGSIVILDPKKSGYVDPANINNASRLLGVAVSSQNSLLAVDPSVSGVQVALAGTVDTLVTSENGNINIGDQISASPFSGIGMEALSGVRVIGIAQTAFPQASNEGTTEKAKDKSGNDQNIKVGYIRLTIAIASGTTTTGGSNQADFLQRVVKSLTGKTIPTFRIFLGMLVAILSFISLVALIYSTVYASIISVGRNPLARTAIYRTLLIVMLIAFLTIIIASLTVYFLLQ